MKCLASGGYIRVFIGEDVVDIGRMLLLLLVLGGCCCCWCWENVVVVDIGRMLLLLKLGDVVVVLDVGGCCAEVVHEPSCDATCARL